MSDENLQRNKVEASGIGIEPKNRYQQRRRRNKSVKKEFERRLRTMVAPVHRDQDRHRNQRKFPEAVIEHQVQRDEYPNHRRLLHEKE